MVRVHGRQFNSRQPSGLNKLAIELSGSADASFVLALPVHHKNLEPECVGVLTREGGEGELMRGIKIHLQDFALKMQGGLCARGGVFAGHYGIYTKSKKHRNVIRIFFHCSKFWVLSMEI